MKGAAARHACAGLCLLALLLTSCVGEQDNTSPDTLLISGKLVSGATPISGAVVSIYQAQTLNTPAIGLATSDANGRFAVNVPEGSGVYYAVARAGTTELAAILGTAPPASITMNELTTVAAAYAFAQFFQADAIIGPAQSLAAAAGMSRNLVDVTTGTLSKVISSSPNADETNAQRVLGTLGNVLAACVQGLPKACSALLAITPARDGTPSTNTLQSAVNLARNPSANVAAIFALGEATKPYSPSLTALQGPNSTDPQQKLDALTLAVKVNATGGDASCQFGGPGNLVFDAGGYAWITINTVQGTPNSAQCLVVLKPDGSPADGSNGTVRSPVVGGGVMGGGVGITVDPIGRVWTGNFGWGNLVPNGSVSLFDSTGQPLSPSTGYSSGLFRVQGTVADKKGNIWMASWGNDSVVVFPDGNPASGYPPFYDCSHPPPTGTSPPYSDCNLKPFGVAVGNDGSAWVAYQRSSTLSKFTLGDTALVKQFTVPVGTTDGNPKGVALDTQGNAWVVSGGTSEVHVFRPDGTALIPVVSGAPLNGPWDLSIDAQDHVWIANFGTPDNIDTRYSLVELCGVTTSNCPPGMSTGNSISPPTGWTLPSAGSPVLLNNGQPLYGAGNPPSFKPLMRLTNAQVDMAGNVWAVNNWKPSGVIDVGTPGDPDNRTGNPGGDGIVIFVGLAAPTLSPNVGQPQPAR